MIGFYISLQNNDNSKIKLAFASFDSFTEKDKSNDCLYIFDRDSDSLFQHDGFTLCVIGTLIYKNKWNKNALRLIAHDLSAGIKLEDIAQNSRGLYSLVVHTDDDTFVVTDKTGSFPNYKYTKNGITRVSNIFPLLPKLNSVTLDFQGLAEFISAEDSFCFSRTLFKEIEHLRGGTIYQFGPRRDVKTYYDIFDDIRFEKSRDLDKISGMAKRILTDNLRFLEPGDKVFADLTGGFDTRLVATLLRHNGMKYDCGICGEQVLNETNLAKEVAGKLGVRFYKDFRIKNYSQFEDTVNLHYSITGGTPQLYHSSELINYYIRISEKYDIHIAGFGGTELLRLGSYAKDVAEQCVTGNGSIDVDKYVRMEFPYLDIFKDRHITEGGYYDRLREKADLIIQRLRRSGIDDLYEMLFPLKFSTCSLLYHGTLIGTHNCIMPFYSPYLESNFVKAMLQIGTLTKYSHIIQRRIISELNPAVAAIMTVHGYTAKEESKTKAAFMSFRNRSRLLTKQIIDKNGMIRKGVERMRRYSKNVPETPPPIADHDRPYWVKEIKKRYSDNIAIFEIIDKAKFDLAAQKHKDINRFMAKIVYINNIIEKYNPDMKNA